MPDDKRTFGQHVRAFFDPIMGIVTLPLMTQGYGTWDATRTGKGPQRCCFGARIERGLTGKHWVHWWEGKNSFITHFSGQVHGQWISELTLYELLYLCGASSNPFGAETWFLPVERVMENLYKIENFSASILQQFIAASEKILRTVDNDSDIRRQIGYQRRKYLKKMWAYRYREDD